MVAGVLAAHFHWPPSEVLALSADELVWWMQRIEEAKRLTDGAQG
ncbi:MAG: GpE family phage tail protein [bacterium]|nr:GpE family phage tail protein [bacterium]